MSLKAKGLNKQLILLEKQHGQCNGQIGELKSDLGAVRTNKSLFWQRNLTTHDVAQSKVRIRELEEEIARLSGSGDTPWGPLTKSGTFP